MNSLAKSRQDTARSTYKFMPIQNFRYNGNINWKMSIKEIDEQLYKKYKFLEIEVENIESKINDM